MDFVEATADQDDIIVRHYMAIWESYGTPPDQLQVDAEAIVRNFLVSGREERSLASFIAFDGVVAAGSASCQLHSMPYPAVVKSERMLPGYIWAVYVAPQYRRQGISKTLTRMAVDHLRRAGCTDVVLHSSEAGEALYRGLGFKPASEMRLKFGDK
ncbi:GNAT family N-acetyltransferase [Chelativorans sp. YIM 93263]|uniref:GNAT family N-acetyltransferase n=1 Tax=Chelativorans sp. YIM 93263 TaxID=2906648 RepID=UPI002378DCDC|nr:GNAT family N-acetyltransferase [Chelativorans sp. YIM 93263]